MVIRKGSSGIFGFLISLIGIFVMSLAIPQTGLGLTLYDDFSSPTINSGKWLQYELAREISNGQARLKLRSSTNTTGQLDSGLYFQDPPSVNAIEVKVTTTSFDNPQGARPFIFIGGRFFNAGEGTTGDYTGDVFAQVAIGGTGTSPVATWSVIKYTANDTSQYDVIHSGTFALTPVLGTQYTVFVGWEAGPKQFTFRISDGTTTNEQVSEVDLTVAAAHMPAKLLWTRIANNAGKEATIEALFDDVKINGSGTVYDNFSGDTFDVTKWRTNYEQVRDLDAGALRLGRRTDAADTGAYSGIVLEVANPESIKTLQAQVTPLVYSNPNGLDTKANISGRYYNDGTNNGYQGDVIAGVGLGGTAAIPVAFWTLRRHTDPTDSSLTELVATGDFSTPIILGTPYTLFVSWDGADFIFKVNNEVATYTPATVQPPNYPMRRLQTRALNAGGQESFIEVQYDEVMVGFETFRGTVGTLITITDTGFGTNKGTVKVGGKTCKVSAWATDSITCEIKNALPPPGPYDIEVKPKEPKGVVPITYRGLYTMMAPEITSVEPNSGSAPAEIVLSGYYFGTKKGKVYLEDSAGKKKTCKVTEWSMYDKVYGDSSIRFIVPKVSKSLPAGSYVLKVENKVGAVIASTNFTLQ
jgi:hypothetical protein